MYRVYEAVRSVLGVDAADAGLVQGFEDLLGVGLVAGLHIDMKVASVYIGTFFGVFIYDTVDVAAVLGDNSSDQLQLTGFVDQLQGHTLTASAHD